MAELDNNTTEAVKTTEGAPADSVESTQPVDTNTDGIPTVEQVAKFFGTDAEKISKFNTFVEANGKFDTAFAKLKKDVSAPAENTQTEQKQENTQEPTQQSSQQPQPQPQPQPQMEAGYISPKDFALRQYFAAVANEDKYSAIKDDITSGKVFNEMKALGIQATDAQGNYNDKQIHAFLDLKAQTIPATQSTVEPTTTPTVQYTNIEGDISSTEQAWKVIRESNGNSASNHPKYEEAKKFIAKQYGLEKPENPKGK